MRVLGRVEQLIDEAHDIYKKMTGREAREGEEGEDGEESEAIRKESIQLWQQLIDSAANGAVSNSTEPVSCRSDNGSSSCQRYCSIECESTSWQDGHSILCTGRTPELGRFFESRNIVRNPDAQIAIRILAQFIARVQQQQVTGAASAASTPSSSSSSPSSDSPLPSSSDSVAALWRSLTAFHAQPWSLVLALQAIMPDGGDMKQMQNVLPKAIEIINKQDKDARERDGRIKDDTPLSSASTATSITLDSSEEQLLSTLLSTQSAYRGALAEGFNIFLPIISSAKVDDLHQSLWTPYVTLIEFDRLAGANRLNCTLTQTCLPIPSREVLKVPLTMEEQMKLLRSNEDELEESSSLAATSSSSSSSSSMPPILSSLLSLFRPMSLPLANAKGLFLWHSKMNHSCFANARVENACERKEIAYAIESQQMVQQQEEERQKVATLVGKGNKKKRQKNKKQAELDAIVEKKRQVEQLEQLRAIVQRLNASSSSSSPSLTTPSADGVVASASSIHTSQILIRSTRTISEGEEICINYLPPTHEFANNTLARQAYLYKNYLFKCRCERCTQ